MNTQDRTEFDANYGFQKPYLDQVRNILLTMPMRMFYSYMEATEQQDTKQATDAVLVLDAGVSIGVRIRRDNTAWRDWTVRSQSAGGGKTELSKPIEGYCNFYFYGWTAQGRIAEWMLLDLDAIRKSGLLLTERKDKFNKDGVTAFRIYSFNELQHAKAVRCAFVKGKRHGYNVIALPETMKEGAA